jgi:hypothetical protein
MFGNNCVETYSQTQETVEISSGGSEFDGIVKAAARGLGMMGLTVDLGVEVGAQENTDSSTAESIASRRGAGRVRRIEARELCIQEGVAKGERRERRGGCLTKDLERHNMDAHMKAH